MKISKLALLAAIACGVSTASAANPYGSSVNRASFYGDAVASPSDHGIQQVGCCDTCGEPACGCEAACDPACGAESAGCDNGCDSGCDSICGGGCGGDLDILPDSILGFDVGGWIQLGYHSANSPLRFNNHADRVRLHQAYLYLEDVADGSCGLDLGGRVDYVYGVDAQDTQSFGQANGFDATWDNGIYGHALPQLYGEVAYGDTSVKIGHFYTIIGYEVVTAPQNFFYSHSYTMYNSEPFTHTGVLATQKLSDDVTFWGGYVMGWDSGFEDNGDAFLGGVSYNLSDDINIVYCSIDGRFSEVGQGGAVVGVLGESEQGHMHSFIANVTMTEKLSYVFWSDYLDTETSSGALARNTFDITQYLTYSLNDCWSLGSRFEWYNVKRNTFDNADVYALTFGAQYHPTESFLVRPEVRWDWDKDTTKVGINENNNASQTAFGVDAIWIF